MPAKTREDVEAQSTKDRLWESLDYTYGEQRNALNKSYDQAYSQADRQLLSRGMQRSSYGAQTLANINQQRIEADKNSWMAQIADYQNRLNDQEQQDWAREFQEKQFNEGVRQFEQGNANNLVMNILASGQMPSDEALAAAGISKADAELMRSYYAEQIAAANASKSGGSNSYKPKPTNNDTGDDKNNKGTTPDYASLIKSLDFAGLNALRTNETASLRGMIDAQKDINSGTANTSSAQSILQGGLNARTSTLALENKKKK